MANQERIRARACLPALSIGVLLLGQLRAQDVPTPTEVLGFDPTAAGNVVDTRDVARYGRVVDAVSDRATFVPFGLSTDGSPLWRVMVSTPENLSCWREARRTGDRIFALITCGIHPDEVGSTAAFFPLLYRLVADQDASLDELLEKVIVILVPAMNPDGTDRVAAWLRREGRAAGVLPVLYQRYCGHDLNRDWVLATQAETRAVVRGVHHVFLPWVTIDLHQMGRLGPRLFVPPYAEPLDPFISWDLRAHLESLGDQVFESLRQEGRQGIVRRWVYDSWTPARAYPFYHGGLRFLLEVASANYTHAYTVEPSELWISGTGNGRTADHPHPWTGGNWGLPEITDLLVETTLKTLHTLLEEPLRSGQQAHFHRAALEEGGVLLDGRGVDPGIAATLLRRLALTGVRITAGQFPSTWILRDPPWGTGWCRSLLLCTPYPSPPGRRSPSPGHSGFNATPYDTAAHDIARMAGLKAEPWNAPPESTAEAIARRAEALAGRLEGKTEVVASPPPPPGRQHSLPGSGPANLTTTDWLVTNRSITTTQHLADLLEAGVKIRRLATDVRVETLTAGAGDFLLEGIHPDWVERLVNEGADAFALDARAREALREDQKSVELRYPRLWILQGPLPSIDEGWLRWVLEAYRFRFQRIMLDELLVERDFARRASPTGRAVLIVPEGTVRRPHPRMKRALEEFVERHGRVIALGRAAKWIADTCDLPLDELPLEASALPGTILRTNSVARAGFRDSTLWGLRRAPEVFYHHGVLWQSPMKPHEFRKESPRGTGIAFEGETLLEIDATRPLVCGLLDPRHAVRVRGAAAVVRFRHRSSGGEWLLCGFRPHFRSWTLGTFRLLFNMILAP